MRTTVSGLIAAATKRVKFSGDEEYAGIDLLGVRQVAAAASISEREVEIAALREGIIPVRYRRNIPSLGIEGQVRLLAATAAVVGAGGLGGLIIELLARAGVGRLILIDGDSFAEDNLNRQLLCREGDLGRKKIAAAGERVAAVNSAVEVIAHPVFLTADNAAALLAGAEVVIDALDRISVRILLEKTAARLSVPLVHGAIGGLIGQVATVRPGEEILSISIYGREESPPRGIEAVLGTPTITPAVVASLEAMEAVKILLGWESSLANELLYLDLESLEFSRIPLKERDKDGD